MGQALQVQVQGQGVVNADNFNTYQQSADNVAALRAFIGTAADGIIINVYVRGLVSINDGGQGQFYWNATAISPVDDGVNTIVPTGASSGCWSRLTSGNNASIPVTVTGSNDIVMTGATGVTPITKYANNQQFSFVAAASSTGNVTASYDALATLPVYQSNGQQAAAGAFTAGLFYILAYVSSYNANAGGFVIISAGTSSSSSSAAVVPPQGRLTLTSGSPIMTSDVTAATAIYYDPYVGSLAPLYSGSAFVNSTFAELTLTLDSNSGHTGYQQSGNLFDLFLFLNGAVITLGTGPAWSTPPSTGFGGARGTGAGTTQVQLLSGIWTNANTITLRFGNGSGNTASISANQATYIGTMYATANGQTAMQFKPAAASGGTANFMALWNAYNREEAYSLERDSKASWTYATATWQPSDGGSVNLNNRISYVDGLAQSPVGADFTDTANGSGAAGTIGININSTTATPAVAKYLSDTSGSTALGATVIDNFPPTLGLNYIQAMEYATGATATFFGSGSLSGSPQSHALRIQVKV